MKKSSLKMKKSKLYWIFFILLLVLMGGYLFFVVSGISGNVIDAVEKFLE